MNLGRLICIMVGIFFIFIVLLSVSVNAGEVWLTGTDYAPDGSKGCSLQYDRGNSFYISADNASKYLDAIAVWSAGTTSSPTGHVHVDLRNTSMGSTPTDATEILANSTNQVTPAVWLAASGSFVNFSFDGTLQLNNNSQFWWSLNNSNGENAKFFNVGDHTTGSLYPQGYRTYWDNGWNFVVTSDHLFRVYGSVTDGVGPVITWGSWYGKNTTITVTNTTNVTVTTNEFANCTLHINYSAQNHPNGTVTNTTHSWNLTNIPNGNYTINITCEDEAPTHTTSTNTFLNISHTAKSTTYLSPTSLNDSTIDIVDGENFKISSRLIKDDGAGISGQKINFYVNTTNNLMGFNYTNSTGYANWYKTLNFTYGNMSWPISGYHDVIVAYPGNTTYLGVTNQTQTVLLQWWAKNYIVNGTSTSNARGVDIADFDGDGLMDIVIAESVATTESSKIVLCYNTTGKDHSWECEEITKIDASADITNYVINGSYFCDVQAIKRGHNTTNQDGGVVYDIIVAQYDSAPQTINGSLTYLVNPRQRKANLEVPGVGWGVIDLNESMGSGSAHGLTVGDLGNGTDSTPDGLEDIVLFDEKNGTLTVYFQINFTLGTYISEWIMHTGEWPVASGGYCDIDIDDDGDYDITGASDGATPGSVYWFENNMSGNASFFKHLVGYGPDADKRVYMAHAGDWNNDGDMDIAYGAHGTAGALNMTLGPGLNRYLGQITLNSSTTLGWLELRNFGRGAVDIAWTSGGVHFGTNSSGNFRQNDTLSQGTNAAHLITHDIDNDLDLDIVFVDQQSHTVNVLENEGTGTDNVAPTLTWNWSVANTSVTSNYTRIIIKADEVVDNCTIEFNGTNISMVGWGRYYQLYRDNSLLYGNYSEINVTCYDPAGNAGTSTDMWLNITGRDVGGGATTDDRHFLSACSNLSAAGHYYILNGSISNYGFSCFNITAAVTLDCNATTIDGSDPASGTATGVNITSTATGTTIVNCTITDFVFGIDDDGGESVIQNNTILSVTKAGMIANATKTLINNNTFGASLRGIWLDTSENNITSNTIDSTTYYSLILTADSEDNIIKDNEITSASSVALYDFGSRNNSIENNTMSASSDVTAYFANAVNVSFENNTASNSGTTAIYFYLSDNNTIRNNTLSTSSNQRAFLGWASTNLTIANNSMATTTGSAMYLDSCNDSLVANNSARATTGTAMYNTQSHNVTYKNNTVHAGNYGLYLYQSQDNRVGNMTIITTSIAFWSTNYCENITAENLTLASATGINISLADAFAFSNISILATDNGVYTLAAENDTYLNLTVESTNDAFYISGSTNTTITNTTINAGNDIAIGAYGTISSMKVVNISTADETFYSDDGAANTYYIYNSTLGVIDGKNCDFGGGCNAETFYLYDTIKANNVVLDYDEVSHSDKVYIYYYHRVNITNSSNYEQDGANAIYYRRYISGVSGYSASSNIANKTTDSTGFTPYYAILGIYYNDHDGEICAGGCVSTTTYQHRITGIATNDALGISGNFTLDRTGNETNLTVYNPAFIPPTPNNNTYTENKTWIFINVSTSGMFNGDEAFLEWNATKNYTMINFNSTLFYINFTIPNTDNGTSFYQVWVNTTYGDWSSTKNRTIDANLTFDTTPAILWCTIPTNNTEYGSSSANTNVTLVCYSNEDCSLAITTSPTTYANSDNDCDITGSTNHRCNATLPNAGGNQTYYLRCNDSANNVNTDDYHYDFRVQSAGGGGGGGGGGITPGVIPGVFHLEPMNCWDPVERKNVVCPYEVYGSGSKTYEICSDSSSDITVEISFEGYQVNESIVTDSLMSASEESVELAPEECKEITISNTYPDDTTETYSDSEVHPFNAIFTSTGSSTKLPLTILPPTGFIDFDAVVWEGDTPLGFITLTTGHVFLGLLAFALTVVLVFSIRRRNKKY